MRTPALAALGLCAALVTPASATHVSGGLDATIVPDETGGACITVTGATGTFAGEFSGAGDINAIVADGVMVFRPMLESVPIVNTTTACIEGVRGGYHVSGHVVFRVAVADQTREFYVENRACTYGSDELPCP